jgi:adenosylmethionine-8-amino-7-oxononanoate aminotransferase
VFLTTGGSEAVESAWKLARQYFVAVGQPDRVKVIARRTAYHGTTLGALAITGPRRHQGAVPAVAERAVPPRGHHQPLHCDLCAEAPACTLGCADDVERAILAEGPETVAAVFLEPVQNAGGCFTPADGYFDGSGRSATGTASCSSPTR